MNTIQDGIISSGDVITYFLGIASNQVVLGNTVAFIFFSETGLKRTHIFLQGTAKGFKRLFGWNFTPSLFFLMKKYKG